MNSSLDTFQNFRQTLCLCPCCGDIVRLSDLNLRYKGAVKKTWLDNYDQKKEVLDEKHSKFLEKEKDLREKARESGRKKVQEVVNNAVSPAIRKLKLNPYDIKPVLHPIDFLVFKGMNSNKGIDDIMFLSRLSSSAGLNSIRGSIKDVIQKEKYDWKVARVSETGEIEFE